MATNQGNVPEIETWKNMLIKAVGNLKANTELPGLTKILSQLLYLVNHPECISDFEKESLLDDATDCMNFLGNLSDVYEWYILIKKATPKECTNH